MSMKVGDKTYSSDDVKRAIENGTNAYYDDPMVTISLKVR